MNDDEILQLVDTVCPSREYVRIMTNQDLIDFAEAVAHRTLTNQKAKWYQEGVESGLLQAEKEKIAQAQREHFMPHIRAGGE